MERAFPEENAPYSGSKDDRERRSITHTQTFILERVNDEYGQLPAPK